MAEGVTGQGMPGMNEGGKTPLMRVMASVLLFAVLLGLDPHTVWRLRVFNCSLSGVEIGPDGPALVFSNDDLHLRWASEDGCGDTGGRPLPLW